MPSDNLEIQPVTRVDGVSLFQAIKDSKAESKRILDNGQFIRQCHSAGMTNSSRISESSKALAAIAHISAPLSASNEFEQVAEAESSEISDNHLFGNRLVHAYHVLRGSKNK